MIAYDTAPVLLEYFDLICILLASPVASINIYKKYGYIHGAKNSSYQEMVHIASGLCSIPLLACQVSGP